MEGLLKRAAGTETKLEMIYLSNDGTVSQRIIKVLKVTDESVKAYCYYRKRFRSFKLENILSVGPLRQKRGA
ncbi:hypothetical protein [Lederbergia lenta]|uniref:hypothetical protein n=1 Tax=Lederbergia lenta TaxID=1467 RepID=UPI00203DAD40|nr:hypothetical protein [Lederbergia lenta]MCM3110697.1 hypothetical protein [Lederbergia lenta]